MYCMKKAVGTFKKVFSKLFNVNKGESITAKMIYFNWNLFHVIFFSIFRLGHRSLKRFKLLFSQSAISN